MSQATNLLHADGEAHGGYLALTPPLRTDRSVLHLFGYFRPDFTGEGLYLEKLAPELAARGIQSTVVATRTRGKPGSRYPAELGRPVLFGGSSSTFNLRMLCWLVLHAWQYDVVHFHASVDRYFLAHMIARLSGCRVVQSATLDDGLASLIAGYRRPYRWAVRRLCGLIHTAVAISPRLYRNSLDVLPPERVRMVPQGVAIPKVEDPKDRQSARARWGFAADDVVLLFVGGLCARKDVRFLVEHHPGPASGGKLRLLLVGPDLDADYVAALREAIAASPCAERIVLDGYLDDPSPAFRAADAFVFASRQEGFGNVLLEAMAHGLPVVSRRLPGVTDEFIEDGHTGFLFDTPDEYAALVLRLAQDPALRGRIGEAARQSACLSYDLRAIADRYAAIYGAAK